MSEAVVSTGIKVQRALLATPTAFTDIGEIVHVLPPGFSRNELESSTHNDGTESKVLGILRQRSPTFRINYVGGNTTHVDLLNDLLNNVKNRWRFVFPSGANYTGDARVQRFDLAEAPVDAIQQAECGISWAGPVTPATTLPA